MTAADLATAGFIDEWMRVLLAHVQQQQSPPVPAPAEVVLYSLPKLAAVLDVHPDTVRAWISTGKKGKNGQRVKLQVYRFTSEARIAWPALLAYERGEAFDLASLPAPLLTPPAELAPAPIPKLTTPTEPPAQLRVA